MAINRKSFQTRAITAIVFAGIMLAGLLLNPLAFLILFLIIHFGCWWEFLSLIEKIHKTVFHNYIKLGLICMGYGIMLSFWHWSINHFSINQNLPLPVSAAGFAVLIMGIFQQKTVSVKGIFSAMAGLVYISLSLSLMLDLYKEHQAHLYDTYYIFGPKTIPVLIIASIWINDTMAYIVGSLIGKTPLSSISPKKTWEGTSGGIFLAVLVMAILFPLIFYSHLEKILSFVFGGLAFVASIFGTVGDLIESKLKRMAGVKDSGSIMPGHGGFMDRFDSLLLAVPFVWVYVHFLM